LIYNLFWVIKPLKILETPIFPLGVYAQSMVRYHDLVQKEKILATNKISQH